VNTRRWAVLIVALTLVGGLACVAVAGAQERQPTPEEIAYEIVVLVNDERRARGLDPLVINEQLTWMAQRRSQDMIDGGYYSHSPPPGHPTLGDMCEELGYQSLHAPVENLVGGPVDEERLDQVPEEVMGSWRSSPGHWDWIVDRHQEMTGVGVAIGDGRIVVTQLFWTGSGFTPAGASRYNGEAP
jgi:uncharacterized protein YkwD